MIDLKMKIANTFDVYQVSQIHRYDSKITLNNWKIDNFVNTKI